MIVVMGKRASEDQIDRVIAKLVEEGFDVHRSTGVERTVLGAMGERVIDIRDFELMDGVEEVVRVTPPYRLCSRAARPDGSRVRVGDVVFGGLEVPIIAGPCAVEGPEQIGEAAALVARSGGRILRGGTFLTDTGTGGFPGHGEMGLKMLREAADRNGLQTVSEVQDSSQIPVLLEYVDMLQVGARNMQNTHLLRAVGKAGRPVLLKRGLAARIEDLLMAAECLAREGNCDVVLCERGVRTFEGYQGVTLDLSSIPTVHRLSHLPIIADPSHGTGRKDKVAAMARAAVAAGADGLMIEVHPDPASAMSDGSQSLDPGQFRELMGELRAIAEAIGRNVAAAC